MFTPHFLSHDYANEELAHPIFGCQDLLSDSARSITCSDFINDVPCQFGEAVSFPSGHVRLSNCRSKCSFDAPVVIKTIEQGPAIHSQNLSPFRQASAFSSILYQVIISLIAILFFSCGPVTILRRIGAVIVFAFHRMTSRRAWSHIVVKCFKAFTPTSTNRDAASAIILISRIVRIGTALKNVFPYRKFSRASSAVFEGIFEGFHHVSTYHKMYSVGSVF